MTPDRLLEAAAACACRRCSCAGSNPTCEPRGAAEFQAAVPHARFVDVSGAGHMVAGDRNDLFTEAVIEFLRRDVPR